MNLYWGIFAVLLYYLGLLNVVWNILIPVCMEFVCLISTIQSLNLNLVKGSHSTFFAEGKGKAEYLYSAFLAKMVHSKRSGMDHTVLPANNTMPAFPSWAFTRCHHHSNWGSGHPIASQYSFIDPERMKGWVGLVACLSSQVKCNFLWTVILCTLFMVNKFYSFLFDLISL